MNIHPTTVRGALRTSVGTFLRHDLLPLLALLGLAAAALYFVSGCTAAAFDTQESDDEHSADTNEHPDEGAAPGTDAAVRPSLGRPGPRDFALRSVDAAPAVDAADAAPVPDTAPGTDGGVDAGGPPKDAPPPDTTPDAPCARHCLTSTATVRYLPLGSTACHYDGECCSGTCFVSHPGTGETGTCVTPGTGATWCGAPQEWCSGVFGTECVNP